MNFRQGLLYIYVRSVPFFFISLQIMQLIIELVTGRPTFFYAGHALQMSVNVVKSRQNRAKCF